MSQVMKTYIGVFLFLLLAFTAVGILGAYIQVLHAQDMHERIIEELENSDFYEGVFEDAYDQVHSAGGSLKFTIYANGQTYQCESVTQLPENLGMVDLARVDLMFPIRIPVIGIQQYRRLSGYAR